MSLGRVLAGEYIMVVCPGCSPHDVTDAYPDEHDPAKLLCANCRQHVGTVMPLASATRIISRFLDFVQDSGDPDIEAMERMAKNWLAPSQCQHEWIDIRNSVVISGSMCKRCGILRKEDVDEL